MDPKLVKRMTYIPVERATTPRTGDFRLRVNAWWSVIDHGGIDCIMLYAGYAPQCNDSEVVVKSINSKLYPEAKVVQLPVVYIPISYKDFV